MTLTTLLLVLLFAVVASGVLNRAAPFTVPLPLVQIGVGASLALAVDLPLDLNPDVFFLVFLPPLLFLDGWRISKQALLHEKRSVLELAVGLVLLTVLGLGFFIHWLIPAMPLAVAFALAAALSPTDPVAVAAIGGKVPIPGRLMHILEGESLLNDAAGLVCMRFAIAAALTGAFSPIQATLTFIWLAAGGVASGAAIVWVVTAAKNRIARRLGEEPGSQILISLMLPFWAYLLAEHLHSSGILAAVSAGVTMGYLEQSGQASASTRIRRSAVWDAVAFALNGLVFILLGAQLPKIFTSATPLARGGEIAAPDLLLYAIVIAAALLLLRFSWVWLSLTVTMVRARRSGRDAATPGWRLTTATSLAGVRGAVTLAGILTLPLALLDGAPFPARDLAIHLAAWVILISLLAASWGLPLALRNLDMPVNPIIDNSESQARRRAAEAAIEAIGGVESFPFAVEGQQTIAEARADLIRLYRSRVENYAKVDEDARRVRQLDQIDRALRLTGIRAEREAVYRLARTRQLSDDVARKLVRELDLVEARLGAS